MPQAMILNDDGARHDAISRHDRSILVEAGAGSGKTAVMAGRVAVMLAQGVPPSSIAAVTFTELAASELLTRVREFVVALAAGDVTAELRVGLPDGLSQAQRDNLAAASAAIDEITCSTIHGFCQRLIKPYPVEADIDPGASVMDSGQADLLFLEIVDAHLRERLSEGQGGILAEMVLHADGATVALMHTIARKLRARRNLVAPATEPLAGRLEAFRQASAELSAFVAGTDVAEPETGAIAQLMSDMAAALPSAAELATPAGLVGLLVCRPHPDLCTKAGTFLSYSKKGKWGAAAKAVGRSTAEGNQLHDEAKELYLAGCAAWTNLLQTVAGHVLAALIAEARPILDRYAAYKRGSAQLDFDDLINAARDMLRDQEAVRQALGRRYEKVLIDEFQDTDPLQSEILWRLAITEIAALRADLLPEFPVYALREEKAGLVATAGVADALTTDVEGRPVVIVDWKSDVTPEPATIEHYRAQVRAYLAMTGAEHGLIVMMTTGQVIEVAPAPAKSAA